MQKPEVYIVGGARTPMTGYVGALKDLSAIDLGAIASRGAFERTGVNPESVEHVVFGNVLQTSSDAIYCARHIGLKSGVPLDVPALTVNRLCGSGIQAAVSGAQMIQLGEAGVVLTGGVESMRSTTMPRSPRCRVRSRSRRATISFRSRRCSFRR